MLFRVYTNSKTPAISDKCLFSSVVSSGSHCSDFFSGKKADCQSKYEETGSPIARVSGFRCLDATGPLGLVRHQFWEVSAHDEFFWF